MVVLIHFVVALLLDDFLCGVVLVPRTHIPSFDVGGDASTARVVVLTLKSWIFQQVSDWFTRFHAPFRLQCQVGGAERVDKDAVAINDDTFITRHCIAIRMIESIGVVERSTIRWVRQSFLRGRVVESHAR